VPSLNVTTAEPSYEDPFVTWILVSGPDDPVSSTAQSSATAAFGVDDVTPIAAYRLPSATIVPARPAMFTQSFSSCRVANVAMVTRCPLYYIGRRRSGDAVVLPVDCLSSASAAAAGG
jgi:hypothetical protein